MKKLPRFKTIKEEDKFWQSEDSAEYINWAEAKIASFPNLRPSSETISLRLPATLLNELKIIAHKEDIPYQSLIKIMLSHEISLARGKSY